ncbi:MAG: peptide-methionine (S)-S-oxide reductase MsrA [Candidatus Nanoarchaeia archaeon]|nr:peptide-methionine (S)-S-oxide reductase MsrA [Candidatus Nanoarchaeia archaeon]
MKAAFGMGCFWHSQKIFDNLKGVKKTFVGYMGGKIKNPNYILVCTGLTGHAETVFVEYNPKIISYNKLLEIFFKSHDYSQKNRQGFDIGSQYRGVIFYYNQSQKKIAQEKINELKKIKKVATELIKATEFYKAEEYHQHYIEKNGGKTCQI